MGAQKHAVITVNLNKIWNKYDPIITYKYWRYILEYVLSGTFKYNLPLNQNVRRQYKRTRRSHIIFNQSDTKTM